MNKTSFLNYMGHEDKTQVLKLYEKLSIAEKTGGTIYLNEFYPPVFWNKLQSLTFDTNVYCNGFFEEAERRTIFFSSDEEENVEQPYKLIKIENKSKFHKLEHKDYLGALMALGLKREKFGDMLVKDCYCYFPVSLDIYKFVLDNLQQVGKCPCSISLVEDISTVPVFLFEEKTVISTSERLDCIVAAITGLSRSKAVEVIEYGKVLLNYLECKEKNCAVRDFSTITIRGYGKFKLYYKIGSTKSGRLKLLIKKFI